VDGYDGRGALVGLGLGLFIGNQSWYAGTPVEAGLTYGLFGLVYLDSLTSVYTGESATGFSGSLSSIGDTSMPGTRREGKSIS
jgi:hypothetical protein